MKYFLYSIISGLLLGLGSIMLKTMVENKIFYLIILDPLFLVASVVGIIAFILSQIALKHMKSSNVVLLITVTVTIISVIGGSLLGEFINIYETAGIMLMIGSIIFLLLKSKVASRET